MANLLTSIGSVITAVGGWITSAFTTVASLFYDAETGFNWVGTLLLVGFGLGLIWTLIKFVKGIVKRG